MTPGEQLAVYRVNRTGKRYELRGTVTGNFYEQGLDDRTYSRSMGPDQVRWLQQDTVTGEITWLQTPHGYYHCWHVCTCAKCAPAVLGSIWGERSSGKVWSHSQADWDDHLRYVENAAIYTFPAATSKQGAKT